MIKNLMILITFMIFFNVDFNVNENRSKEYNKNKEYLIEKNQNHNIYEKYIEQKKIKVTQKQKASPLIVKKGSFNYKITKNNTNLSKNIPKKEQPVPKTHFNDQLRIPGLNLEVRLEYCDAKEDNQNVVDKENIAVYLNSKKYGYSYDLIADHKNQGFYKIKKATPNKTIAYIESKKSKIRKFICTDKFNGYNSGTGIFNDHWVNCLYTVNDELIIYTCNEDRRHITITTWKEI